MARGRQQKWVCKDCQAEFSVQGHTPKFCCACGSDNIGRAPSYELVLNFEEKRRELDAVCKELNPAFVRYMELKERYDEIMAYWKQQRRRGFISAEEYANLSGLFWGDRVKKNKEGNNDGEN